MQATGDRSAQVRRSLANLDCDRHGRVPKIFNRHKEHGQNERGVRSWTP